MSSAGGGNPVARALGHHRPAVGRLCVWVYARVDPERAGALTCGYSTTNLVYFVRINKLPRRLNVSTWFPCVYAVLIDIGPDTVVHTRFRRRRGA